MSSLPISKFDRESPLSAIRVLTCTNTAIDVICRYIIMATIAGCGAQGTVLSPGGRFGYLGAHGSISVRPPDTPFVASEFLKLPDFDVGFALLERLFSRLPCCFPVQRGYGNQDAFFPNRDPSQPMDHRYRGKTMFGEDVFGDGEESVQGFRDVGCVLELLDWLAVEVVTGGAWFVDVIKMFWQED